MVPSIDEINKMAEVRASDDHKCPVDFQLANGYFSTGEMKCLRFFVCLSTDTDPSSFEWRARLENQSHIVSDSPILLV